MNGARSTYMRKGYLLTALAAAVLLAASSGTAYAQSIGFDKTSGSVMEKAFVGTPTANSSKHAPLEIKVRVSGLPPVGDTTRTEAGLADTLGAVTLSQEPDGALTIYRVPPTTGGSSRSPVAVDGSLTNLFVSTDEVTLLVAPGESVENADDNWVDNKVVVALSAATAGVITSPNQVVVTIVDQDLAPVVKFDRADVLLTEDSDTSVEIDVQEWVQDGKNTYRFERSTETAQDPICTLVLSVSNPRRRQCRRLTVWTSGVLIPTDSLGLRQKGIVHLSNENIRRQRRRIKRLVLR